MSCVGAAQGMYARHCDAVAMYRACHIVLAIEQFKAERGRLPTSLAETECMVNDPSAGAAPFQYRLEAPDCFHDMFGHIPMLAHHDFAEMVEHVGRLGLAEIAAGKSDRVPRIYWHSVEFGLAREGGVLEGHETVASFAVIDLARL